MISRAGLAALLAALVLVGSARSSGADGLARSGFEWWRLRPTDVTTTGSTGTPPRASRDGADAQTEAPGERRAVRVVYPGLTAGR